jgi:hypothetical protein
MSTSASSKLACAAKDKRLKPRALIAVDLFGLAADYEALNAFCDGKVLLLIADVTAQPTQHSGPRNRQKQSTNHYAAGTERKVLKRGMTTWRVQLSHL